MKQKSSAMKIVVLFCFISTPELFCSLSSGPALQYGFFLSQETLKLISVSDNEAFKELTTFHSPIPNRLPFSNAGRASHADRTVVFFFISTDPMSSSHRISCV